MRRSEEFRRWTTSHAGVFTRAVALKRGVSPKQFRLGVEAGEWVRFRGAWILADYPTDIRSNAWAGLLRAGPNARITGLTCTWIHGLKLQSQTIFLSVPEQTNRVVEGAVLLRDRDRQINRFQVAGFPAVSRERAVVDALRLADSSYGREILHEALRLGWINCGQLDWWCDKLKRHRGLTNLKAQAVYASSGSRAESERLLATILRAGRLDGWSFNARICDASGDLIGIGDCVNFDLQIVLEVDGLAWHSSVDRFQRDRTRQNVLINAGWHVLRFTWPDLMDRPDKVVADIRTAMARCQAPTTQG